MPTCAIAFHWRQPSKVFKLRLWRQGRKVCQIGYVEMTTKLKIRHFFRGETSYLGDPNYIKIHDRKDGKAIRKVARHLQTSFFGMVVIRVEPGLVSLVLTRRASSVNSGRPRWWYSLPQLVHTLENDVALNCLRSETWYAVDSLMRNRAEIPLARDARAKSTPKFLVPTFKFFLPKSWTSFMCGNERTWFLVTLCSFNSLWVLPSLPMLCFKSTIPESFSSWSLSHLQHSHCSKCLWSSLWHVIEYF